MNEQDLKGYTSSDIVRVLSKFINERADKNREALNDSYAGKLTDGGNDSTAYLKGVSSAYASVKYFIESGLREVPG